jgi:hypothetical protein
MPTRSAKPFCPCPKSDSLAISAAVLPRKWPVSISVLAHVNGGYVGGRVARCDLRYLSVPDQHTLFRRANENGSSTPTFLHSPRVNFLHLLPTTRLANPPAFQGPIRRKTAPAIWTIGPRRECGGWDKGVCQTWRVGTKCQFDRLMMNAPHSLHQSLTP